MQIALNTHARDIVIPWLTQAACIGKLHFRTFQEDARVMMILGDSVRIAIFLYEHHGVFLPVDISLKMCVQ